jgi:hypothetical protein
VALPSYVGDIILQASARREELFRTIYEHGPVYSSNNYGTLSFTEGGRFSWIGNSLLVPQVISPSALGSGVLDMRLHVSDVLSSRYDGAFTMYFDGIGGIKTEADFIYAIDPQGLRIEYVPQTSLDGVIVVRRASSPVVVYFFRNDMQDDRSSFFPQDYQGEDSDSEFFFEHN